MWKVTLKGILAHKVRFLLTGVAVILGVAFISGTLVLTATINKTFDGLFTNIYAEHRRGRAGQGDLQRRLRRRPRARSAPPAARGPQGADGVAAADGTVQGFAIIVDKNGDALREQRPGRADARLRVDHAAAT